MKVIKSKVRHPVKYIFKFELSQEEAIGLVEELGEIKQDMNFNRVVPIPRSMNARLFMTLSDALQDLGLIPMTKGRNKGDESRPRLDNDEIVAKEVRKVNQEGTGK